MQLLNDLTLTAIFSRLAAYLIFCAIHGVAIAAVLRFMGQERSVTADRMTASPFASMSLLGLATTILFRVGWSRPFLLDPAKIQNPQATLLVAAILSLVVSALTVPLIDPIRMLVAQGLPRTAGYAVLQVLVALQDVTKASVILNLLPLPGLTAGLILYAVFPQWTARFNRYALAFLVGLSLALVAGFVPLDPIVSAIWRR